jgi:hypothetical protein
MEEFEKGIKENYRKFKVRKVFDKETSFKVEVEFDDNGDRRIFGFPKNNGWEDDVNGVPKFVIQIKRVLEDEGSGIKKFDINSVKSKVEGLRF